MKPPLGSWKPWVFLALLVMQAHTVSAQPVAACETLALRFATDSGLLDANSIAMLSYCTSQELAQRAGASVKSPAPAVVTPVPKDEWGAWPEAAPWSTRPWPSYSPDHWHYCRSPYRCDRGDIGPAGNGGMARLRA